MVLSSATKSGLKLNSSSPLEIAAFSASTSLFAASLTSGCAVRCISAYGAENAAERAWPTCSGDGVAPSSSSGGAPARNAASIAALASQNCSRLGGADADGDALSAGLGDAIGSSSSEAHPARNSAEDRAAVAAS